MQTIDNSSLFLSFVIPVKDESQTLETLSQGISDILLQTDKNICFEIIFIDDGSTDNSWIEMSRLAEQYSGTIKAIKLRRNFGKAFALSTGFSESQGDIVFTMDADLQDDPGEIPKFLAKIAEGYDIVSGWKNNRQDPLSKTLPSKLFRDTLGYYRYAYRYPPSFSISILVVILSIQMVSLGVVAELITRHSALGPNNRAIA